MKQSMNSFWVGVRAVFPLLIGVFPFGLIYGTLALGAGLSPTAAQMMSSIVFAGSSQFVAAQLIHDAAPGVVIVLTIAIVNLRHMLYSASIAPYLENLSPRWKGLLAYLLTDEAYATTVIHFEQEGIDSHQSLVFSRSGIFIMVYLANQQCSGHPAWNSHTSFVAFGFCPAFDIYRDGHAGSERSSCHCRRFISRVGCLAGVQPALQTWTYPGGVWSGL